MSKQSSEEIHGLDPGIALIVKLLIDAGVHTFESCEGGQGHEYTRPMVKFHAEDLERVMMTMTLVECMEYRVRFVKEVQVGGIETGRREYAQLEFFSPENLADFLSRHKEWNKHGQTTGS